MQPGTFCNLDCRYCYLPDRHDVRHMPPEVNEAVADTAAKWSAAGHGVEALWHLGEPLAVGVERLDRLLSRWPRETSHTIQTNGTLINDAWCDLFQAHRVRLSVSSDGPGPMNADRVTRSGRPAASRIEAGLAALRSRAIPFDLLSVVRVPDARTAGAVYSYARDIGAVSLGILPEEKKGAHGRSAAASKEDWTEFFSALYTEWQRDPAVRLRELESVMNCRDSILAGVTYEQLQDIPVEPMPTVSHNGDVTVLSPDFSGHTHPEYGPFTVGNVLDDALDSILARAHERPWVREALTGVRNCRTACRYASVCGGNWPANKYFELGRLDATETAYCRNLHQAKMEGALQCQTPSQ
ncbi:radical SAM protein [Streptacidiphilus sp. N1-3]|uniref:Radical SAM protein n=1 Tax=Streptacidiphilus alkalitolerans TaxID=3342712 RepID=A0ABV6X6E4_9ACTN